MSVALSHTLELEVPSTACNSLRIIDMSTYVSGLAVECETLEILVPGCANEVVFKDTDSIPLERDFDNKYSASDLGIQATNVSTPGEIPDGMYTIRYSVAPNSVVNVIYYHLRTTNILNEYYKELCKLQLSQCEQTREQKQKLDDLRYIKSLIDAAKAKTEYCHANDQGNDMYNYAKKLLAKYKTGTCITCN